MTKASDNPYPSILIEEASEPTAPASGHQRLYIDSATHTLHRVDENGDEVDLEAASSGIPASLFDAKGDLIAASAADTAARLAVGTDGQLLSADSGETTGLKWINAPSGGEFTEISTLKLAAGGGDINTTSTSFTDLTGASITITTAAVRCLVIVSLMAVNSNAGVSTCFDVDIDGTRFANTTNGIARMIGSTIWEHIGFTFFTDVLSAGSHTFKIQWRVTANTGGVANQSTTHPIIFQVVETSMAA